VNEEEKQLGALSVPSGWTGLGLWPRTEHWRWGRRECWL